MPQDSNDLNGLRRYLRSMAVALAVQIGLLIWWCSDMNTRMEILWVWFGDCCAIAASNPAG